MSPLPSSPHWGRGSIPQIFFSEDAGEGGQPLARLEVREMFLRSEFLPQWGEVR